MNGKQLKRRLTSTVVGKAQTNSLAFLVSKQPFIRKYTDLFDFIDKAEDDDPKAAAAVEHHFKIVRSFLARTLWHNDVYIGVNVIDQLLYQMIHSGGHTDIIADFFDGLTNSGLHRPGMIVYPLHSFGILGLGFMQFFEKRSASLFLEGPGLVIRAQANDADRSKEFLTAAAKDLKIKQKIPGHLIDHFIKSRPIDWITRNPLLVLKVRTFADGYYENQFIFLLKLRLSAALILMLSAMSERMDTDDRLTFGSSSRVNNWQTLDIHHYLVFQTPVGGKKELDVRCVPMNVAKVELAELSDLSADIDPRLWSKPKMKKVLATLHSSLKAVEKGFLEHRVMMPTSKPSKIAQRVYRKLMDSINHFRRSFRATTQVTENVVALAIAFETLLIDFYAPGVTDRIIRRAKICVKGVKGNRKHGRAVAELFERRGEIVHEGRASTDFDMYDARQAYVHCLLKVIDGLRNLPTQGNSPIGHIIGDKKP